MMVQRLKESYGLHRWYEQVPLQSKDREKRSPGRWGLQEGPMDLDLVMGEKQLTFEEDRPRVLFLERQSRMLS